MIQPHHDLQKQVNALAKSHPEPEVKKMDRRMNRLERMNRFYKEKAPKAPQRQSKLFLEFISAISYAITVIKMYRQLTRSLKTLTREVEDEDRLNS